jgi:hypothetical protein
MRFLHKKLEYAEQSGYPMAMVLVTLMSFDEQDR